MPSTTADGFVIEKLAPGVHAAVARAGGDALSNSTIIDLGDATVVYDAMLTPHAGAALGRAARKLTGRPPDFVVDSHYHHDHVWGNGAIAPVHVIATRRTRDLLARRGRDQFLEIRREVAHELPEIDAPNSTIPARDRPFMRGWYRGILAMPLSFRVRLPDVTVDTELTLHGSRRTLRLISRGGGHSPSDLFAWLEDERIAMLGDLVVKRMHPSVGDGFPREWIRILSEVRGLRPGTVVPGHGPVGDARDIDRVDRYLRDLIRLVSKAVEDGTPIGSLSIPERYRSWSGAPFFPSNLARVRKDLGAARRRMRSG